MNQRFQQEEIISVSEQYAENELYKAVSTIGQQLESELPEFGLCPEECFMDTLELLSVIADKGEDILSEVENMWLRKSNEYRRFDRNVNDNEICKAVGIVFGFAILAIDSSRHPFFHHTLPEKLTQVIANHKFDYWSVTLEKIFSVPLPDGWFDTFVNEEFTKEDLLLPKAINTERAQTYFRKAMNKGYMKRDGDAFSWIGVGTKGVKSQLAYFLGLVFGYRHSVNGNNGTVFPEEELNILFNERRLYSLLTQVHNAQKEQAWRSLIDEMFD